MGETRGQSYIKKQHHRVTDSLKLARAYFRLGIIKSKSRANQAAHGYCLGRVAVWPCISRYLTGAIWVQSFSYGKIRLAILAIAEDEVGSHI